VAFAAGALTSQAQVKRWNSRLERLLVETEGLLTCSTILQRKPAYPRVDLLQAWKRVMTMQFHDILPGTSVASVYRRAIREYRDVYRALSALRADGVARIASRIDTREVDDGLVLVNPTGTPYSGAVSVRLPVPDTLVIRDPGGDEVPLVLGPLGDEKVLHDTASSAGNEDQLLPAGRGAVSGLVWVDLPPFGYKLYSIESGVGVAPTASQSRRSVGSIEVGRFRLRLDEETGDIDELFDLEENRVLLSSGSNRMSLFDEHEKATSWVAVLDSEREDLTLTVPPLVAEESAVRTVVETTSIGRYSQFRRRIILYPRLARVDFELAVDWHEANGFLKVDFRPGGPIESVAAGLPYGFEDVTATAGEFLVHRWIRLCSEGGGFALFNDGAYGADRAGGTLRMSVIRTARDMDPEMSHGVHLLRYGLLPVDGSVSGLETAYTAFAASPLAWWTGRHGGGLKTWGRIDSSAGLAAEGRFAASLTDGVALEVLKMPNEFYAPDGFVLRLRELEGSAKEFSAELPLSPRRVEEVDHLERPIDGRGLDLDGRIVRGRIAPYELLTVAAWL
jgi:alpha-mannosidase